MVAAAFPGRRVGIGVRDGLCDDFGRRAHAEVAGSCRSLVLRALDRQLVLALSIAADAKVLDAGCGRGNHVQLFAEARPDGQVTALDVSPAAIDKIRTRFGGSASGQRVIGQVGDVEHAPSLIAVSISPGAVTLCTSSRIR